MSFCESASGVQPAERTRSRKKAFTETNGCIIAYRPWKLQAEAGAFCGSADLRYAAAFLIRGFSFPRLFAIMKEHGGPGAAARLFRGRRII